MMRAKVNFQLLMIPLFRKFMSSCAGQVSLSPLLPRSHLPTCDQIRTYSAFLSHLLTLFTQKRAYTSSSPQMIL